MKRRINYHFLYVIADLIVSFAVTLLAFISFYDIDEFSSHYIPCLIYCGGVATLTVLIFLLFRIYKIVTSEIGIFESIKIMICTLGVHLVGLFVITFVSCLPKMLDFIFIWVLSAFVAIFIHPSIRIFVRVLKIAKTSLNKKHYCRTIVIGAGETGKIVIDESRHNQNNKNKIVAVVDDDTNKIGGSIANIPIKGPINNISEIINTYHAKEVIIAISILSKDRMKEILALLNKCNVRVRKMPLISEMEGPNDKRIMNVNIEDLLNRNPIILDNQEIKNLLYGKTVLVTGAGGSIGSELTRQIFKCHPKTLVLFDIYENSTYDIQMELTRLIREEKIKDINLVTLIGSTYNEVRIEQIFKKYKPDYVYHAAAYKHVPLMEDSPVEAIRTNVIGTYNVAKMCDKHHTKKMILVSTDKAVRPTNVMGATKRFAERIIQYYSSISETKYAAVRFGNVLGSNGSVVPLFKKQIEAGGPVTITDKRIIRYFMTIPEACSLILQCSLYANEGEAFILDMGEPVKILDLAEKLIRQAGLTPYKDIKIIETGLRPGEKLFEELLLDTEHQIKTNNNKIYVEQKENINSIDDDLIKISKAFSIEETKDIKTLLASVINTYKIMENSNGQEK